MRRPGRDRKISGIAVLFQPDVNARAKSAKRKGVTTRRIILGEVIYLAREIWPRREKEAGGRGRKEGEYVLRRHAYVTYMYIRRGPFAPEEQAGRVYMNETASIGNPED